jgi:hypothetical protein
MQGKRVVEILFVLVHQQFIVSKPIIDNSFQIQTGALGCLLIPTSTSIINNIKEYC